jgi:hypothetical protein
MSLLVAGLIVDLALTDSADAQEAGQQSVITLDPRQRQMLPISGATAAYSLDPGVADVVLQDGVPTIVAMAPGTTSVVIVTPAGMQYAPVVVRHTDDCLDQPGTRLGSDEHFRNPIQLHQPPAAECHHGRCPDW